MSWIPKLMLYYQGERVAFADIFLLDKPILSGAYINNDFTVKITNKNDSYIYFYTLDGTEPTKESSVYNDGVVITEACTIKVQAYDGINRSPVITYTVTRVASPMYSIITDDTGATITISCSTQDATIYYRVSGGAWTQYSTPLKFTEVCEIEAYASKAGMLNSVTSDFEIEQVQTPIIYDPDNMVADVVITIIKG